MSLPEDYRPIVEERERVACELVALLPPRAECPEESTVRESLASSALPVRDVEASEGGDYPPASWGLSGKLDREGEEGPLEFHLWGHPSQRLDDIFIEWARLIPGEETDVRDSRWSVIISAVLGQNPLSDFHALTKLIAAAVPEVVLVLDPLAGKPYVGEWIRDLAASGVPPPPATLYSIHAVSEDERPEGPVWMHTHGLTRCGSIELEMFDIPSANAGQMADLINVIGPLFIEQDVPPPGEAFVVGAGIALVWLPWEAAIHQFPPRSGGDAADRDEAHSVPSGVLATPKRGLLRKRHHSPTKYSRRLSRDPLMFLSNMETERMALLAGERFGEFAELHEKLGADEENYVLMVKLGYTVDDARDEKDREHLWFRVHSISDDTVDATLTNEPYGIARMHENDRDVHSLSLLTDWAILCRQGHFGPDTVVHLKRIIEHDAQDDEPHETSP